MITVNSELLTDLSTRQEIIIRDINGQIIASQTIVNNFGFDFAKVFEGDDGLKNWRLYSDAEAYKAATKDACDSLLRASIKEIQRLKDSGVTPFDLVCKRSQFPQLVAMDSYLLAYKTV